MREPDEEFVKDAIEMLKPWNLGRESALRIDEAFEILIAGGVPEDKAMETAFMAEVTGHDAIHIAKKFLLLREAVRNPNASS